MTTTAPVTRAQRRAVAAALLSQAGNIVEFWGEMSASEPDLEGVDAHTVAELIGSWLVDLPGNAWDTRLVDPRAK